MLANFSLIFTVLLWNLAIGRKDNPAQISTEYTKALASFIELSNNVPDSQFPNAVIIDQMYSKITWSNQIIYNIALDGNFVFAQDFLEAIKECIKKKKLSGGYEFRFRNLVVQKYNESVATYEQIKRYQVMYKAVLWITETNHTEDTSRYTLYREENRPLIYVPEHGLYSDEKGNVGTEAVRKAVMLYVHLGRHLREQISRIEKGTGQQTDKQNKLLELQKMFLEVNQAVSEFKKSLDAENNQYATAVKEFEQITNEDEQHTLSAPLIIKDEDEMFHESKTNSVEYISDAKFFEAITKAVKKPSFKMGDYTFKLEAFKLGPVGGVYLDKVKKQLKDAFHRAPLRLKTDRAPVSDTVLKAMSEITKQDIGSSSNGPEAARKALMLYIFFGRHIIKEVSKAEASGHHVKILSQIRARRPIHIWKWILVENPDSNMEFGKYKEIVRFRKPEERKVMLRKLFFEVHKTVSELKQYLGTKSGNGSVTKDKTVVEERTFSQRISSFFNRMNW
ncbi:hypothetical protein Ddc_22850 [Ditylenchus destructor]|nr:hypothetical protein Ddc_22850 [Ditylenchus destructor]